MTGAARETQADGLWHTWERDWHRAEHDAEDNTDEKRNEMRFV
jgi:hypothetical protein